MEKTANMVNITPVLEHLFNISSITNKKELQLLIDTLKGMKDSELPTLEEMAKLSEKLASNSNADKAVAP